MSGPKDRDEILRREIEQAAVLIDTAGSGFREVDGERKWVRGPDIKILADVNQKLEAIAQDPSLDDALRHRVKQLQALVHAKEDRGHPDWPGRDPRKGYELAIELCKEKDTPENRKIFCECAQEFARAYRYSGEHDMTLLENKQRAYGQRQMLEDEREFSDEALLQSTFNDSGVAARSRDLIAGVCALKWSRHSPDDDILRCIESDTPQNHKHAQDAMQSVHFLTVMLGHIPYGSRYRDRILENTKLPLAVWKFVLDTAEQAIRAFQSQPIRGEGFEVSDRAVYSQKDLQDRLTVIADARTHLTELAKARGQSLDDSAVEAAVREVKDYYTTPWNRVGIKEGLPPEVIDYVASYVPGGHMRRRFFTALGRDASIPRQIEACAALINNAGFRFREVDGKMEGVHGPDIKILAEVNKKLEALAQSPSLDDAMRHRIKQLQAMAHAREARGHADWPGRDPKKGYELALELCKENDTPENRKIFCECAQAFAHHSDYPGTTGFEEFRSDRVEELLQKHRAYEQREMLVDERRFDSSYGEAILRATFNDSQMAARGRDLIASLCVLKWSRHSPDEDILRCIRSDTPENHQHAQDAMQSVHFFAAMLGHLQYNSRYLDRVLDNTTLPLAVWKFLLDKAEQTVTAFQSQPIRGEGFDVSGQAVYDQKDLQDRLAVIADAKAHLSELAQERGENLDDRAVKAAVKQVEESLSAPWLDKTAPAAAPRSS